MEGSLGMEKQHHGGVFRVSLFICFPLELLESKPQLQVDIVWKFQQLFFWPQETKKEER